MVKQRLASGTALTLAPAAIVLAILAAVARFPDGLSVLACLLAALVCAWYGVRRQGRARVAGALAAGAAVVGAGVLVVVGHRLVLDVLIVGCVLGAIAMTRIAFRSRVTLPRATPPEHPVLFYNPRSGGGKAERFGLVHAARVRGIEPIELRAGDDLEVLVRAAVASGADALAMAGGDGSQATVARVAAELGLPYACVPAGTRNHFALDLGVDRNDVVGALDAFVTGGERRVDLAEIDGHTFVNNVSLGLYADAVQRPGYRDAKLHTLLSTVPEVIGPDAKPPDVSWSGTTGPESAVAILVSNNAYRLGRLLGSGTRPRLDQGTLGIAVLAAASPSADSAHARRLVTRQWTATTFEVGADRPIAAGVDGEARRLEPPLVFRTRPGALRVRIAPHHPGASPSALLPQTPWQMAGALASLALRGRIPQARPSG